MYVWNIFSLSLADTTLQKNAFQDQTLKADSFNLSPSCLTNTDIFSVKHFGMSFTIPRHFFSPRAELYTVFFPLICVHTSHGRHTQGKAYLHHQLRNTGRPALLLSVQSNDCETESERESAFVLSDAGTEKAVECARINGH